MDIFATTVTSAQLLYSFISACAEFSSDAKSLSTRFEWDVRLLTQFRDYFEEREAAAGGQLSQHDQALLNNTVSYLGELINTVQNKRCKIESKGFLKTQINRARWVYYKNDLKALEADLFEWTMRLDLRLVALPPELRSIVRLDEGTRANAPRMSIRLRIEEYHGLPTEARTRLQDSLLVADQNKDIQYLQRWGRRVTAIFQNKKVIVEFKPHNASLLTNIEALNRATDTIRTLAGSLSFVDPTIIGLLRCVGFFHSPDAENPRFGLVYDVPFAISDDKPRTLKDLLEAKDAAGHRRTATHPLDRRVILARRLASALYFLHAVGWVHKSIRSNNILVLEPSNLDANHSFPHELGYPYLINFESARADTATTDLGMAEIEDQWSLNVYRHPQRQGNKISARFTMMHDVYSLGVVLLEIGLWRPLERYEKELKGKSPTGMRDQLVEMTKEVAVHMGSRYRNLILWCLSDKSEDLGMTSYVEQVLDKLEEMML